MLDIDLKNLDKTHYLLTGLALLTGLIHLYLGVLIGFTHSLGLSFTLAGLGFLAGTAAVLMDYRRKLVYLLGIPFTAGQIVLWYWINQPDLGVFLRGRPLIDFIDKVAQVGLLVLLIYLYRSES